MAAAALACTLAAPPAFGGERMYVGFQDDPSFRWDSDPRVAFDAARRAGASVVRATVHWHDVAPRRPANAADPFDSAYDFSNVDDLVRNAQQRGIEVLLTIWNTPAWANGGSGGNRLPHDLRDLTDFAHALALRYSGRFSAYPFVRFYSVWNEPNAEQFLAPQFDGRGRSVAPRLYARLFEAAYRGLKRGSPYATVAAGETASIGRDRPSSSRAQDTHSPARFAALVARARPQLRFDAWAHHPYPPTLAASPAAPVAWPNIGLTKLDAFGRLLDRVFARRRTRIWVTEYAHQTQPQQERGVSYAEQAAYLHDALALARAARRADLFVWFMLRDHPGERWQSGLLDQEHAEKPAFATFAALARALDARNAQVELAPVAGGQVIHVPALELKWHIPTGARIGIRYVLRACGRVLSSGTPASHISADGWVPFAIPSAPRVAARYELELELHDVHGFRVRRGFELIEPRPRRPIPGCRALR